MFANSLNRWFFRRSRTRRRPQSTRCRLAFEPLETRALPALINWIGGAYSNICQGTQSGSPTAWSNPLNWQGGVVPGANDTAVFPTRFQLTTCGGNPVFGPFNQTPVVDVPVTLAAIDATVNGTTPGLSSLTVNKPLTLTGNTSEWDSGTIFVAAVASFTNSGTLRLANPAAITLTGTLTNQGTIQEAGGADLMLSNGTINNQTGALFDIQVDHGLSFDGANPAAFTNSGTLRKSAGTGLSDIANVTMSTTGGTIDVRTGTLIPWDGSSGVSTGGTFTVAAGATLQITSADTNNSFTGTYTGSGGGKVLLNAGTLTLGGAGATFNFPTDFFEWDTGTITTTGALTNLNSLTLATAATKTLTGSLMNMGTIIHKDAGLFAFSSGSVTNQANALYDFQGDGGIAGTGRFTNRGIVRKSGGTVTSAISAQGFNNNTGAVLDVRTGTLVPWNGTNGASAGGTFLVATGAVLQIANNGATNAFNGTYTGLGGGKVLLNPAGFAIGGGGATLNFPPGMFQLTAGSLTVPSRAVLINMGSITWLGGSITLNPNATLSNRGTLNLASAGPMMLSGGGSLLNMGTILQTGAGDLNLGVTLSNSTRYVFQADSGITGTQAVSRFLNTGTLAKTAGRGVSHINGNAAFFNSRAIDVETGTILNASSQGSNSGGTFTVALGATLDLTGGATVTYSGSYTASGRGTIALASGTLKVGTGGASFNFPAPMFQWTGGLMNLNATNLRNLGTFTLANNATAVVLSGNGTLLNSGTMIQAGTAGLIVNSTVADRTTISNALGATYDIRADAGITTMAGGGTFINQGTFQKSGGTATSAIGISFRNPGTVLARSGTLGIDADSTDVSGSTLASGTWEVFAGATLNLNRGANLTTSSAAIVLDGSNPSFPNLAHLATNGGSLTVQDGGSLILAGTFSNSGTLAMDATSSVTFTGSLSNFANGTLTGGTWTIAGTLRFPNANIITNAANLVLDGSGLGRVLDSNGNNGLANLAANAAAGTLTVQNGETLATAGDFSNLGTLNIDGTSTFRVSGNLTNFDPNSGTLSGGTFLVAGTFQFTGANIVADAANLVLDGTGLGQIVDQSGNNGLANLAAIAATGTLTLQNGYMVTLAGDLANLGYLLMDATSQLIVSGNYTQDGAATLEIQLGGASGPAGQLSIAGAANLNGTLTLTPVNGYVPSTGDAFAILTYGTRNGSDFANPPAGFNESFDDVNGILTVIAQ